MVWFGHELLPAQLSCPQSNREASLDFNHIGLSRADSGDILKHTEGREGEGSYYDIIVILNLKGQ